MPLLHLMWLMVLSSFASTAGDAQACIATTRYRVTRYRKANDRSKVMRSFSPSPANTLQHKLLQELLQKVVAIHFAILAMLDPFRDQAVDAIDATEAKWTDLLNKLAITNRRLCFAHDDMSDRFLHWPSSKQKKLIF